MRRIACDQVISHTLLSLTDRKVVVGTSGGGDSQALLHAMARYRPDIEVVAVYCHHGVRSDTVCEQDIVAVKKVCQHHGIPLVVRRIPVMAHARRYRMGIEESGREWRYAMLAHIARQRGATSVVTAHHLNDAAETALWQLIRGTRTMSAMKQTRSLGQVALLRPFRQVPQVMLQAYCNEHALPVSVDATNHDTRYTRNRIRHSVMPVLHELNPKTAAHIVSFADYVADLHDAVDQLCPMATHVTTYPHGVHIQADVWRLPAVIRGRMLRQVIAHLGIEPHPEWVSQLETAPQRVGSFKWVSGWSRTVSKEGVWLYPTDPTPMASTTLLLHPPQQMTWGRWQIHVGDTPPSAPACPAWPAWSVKLDAAVYTALRLGTRQTGMMIHPVGYDQPISLQSFLISQRVPHHLRDTLPLFFNGDQLVWGPMLRRSIHVSCQSSAPDWVYLSVSLG